MTMVELVQAEAFADRADQGPSPAECADDELTVARAKIANLELALVSARRIGMALGILMTRHGLTDQQAFERLRAASQTRRVKLRELAEQVIFTGTLDN
jgi:AmiR/NasT family two-component response regulator